MKGKTFSIETLKQLLGNEKSKTGQLRNTVNESFQEYQFFNLDYLKTDTLESLIHIASKATFQSTAFETLLKNINRISSSVLSFGQQIIQIVQAQQFTKVSQKESYSQSLLLAFFIAKSLSVKVDLVGFEKSLRGVGHLIAEQNEADRLGFTKQCAAKEGVILHSINDWEKQTWIGDQSIVLIDIFGLNPVEYRPFLLKHYPQLKKSKKVIIYHSHLQDEQVAIQIKQMKAEVSDWFSVQICPEHPLQCIVQKDEKAMFERLFIFLREESLRSEKQDVVIFMPADTHVRRFSGKLSEQISKHHLKEEVNVITKPHQPHPLNKNNIFLVFNTTQLTNWDYDYARLFYALDYESESSFRFDYDLECYVHSVGNCSGIEKAKRMAVVGSSKVGRYACLSSKISANLHYTDLACELSTYILRMIALNISHQLQFRSKRVITCLKMMQSIGILRLLQNGVQLLDERVAGAARDGVNPIEAKLVLNILDDSTLSKQKKSRLSNLMIMAFVAFHNEGSLRQGKQEVESAAHIKPNGIWRKSGYLQSCLQILTKYELIDTRKSCQNSKSESFRRKTSKMNEYQKEVYGCLFQITEPKKKSYDEMDQQEFLTECIVNHDLFMQIREEIFDFRDALQIQKENIIFQKEDLQNVVNHYLKQKKRAIATYSGSRRQGYKINNQLNSVFPDKASLMSQLNQRPQFLLLIRLSHYQNRYQILMSNSFSSEIYMDTFGSLPIRKSQSQSQIQIQFHGISNSTFEQLWKSNGISIVKFQTQFNCFIEPNQQMAMIVIHCSKEQAGSIKSNFESVLGKIRQKMSVSNKMVHYLGNTNLLLGAGGSVAEIIKANYIDKCILGNLHLDVTQEDLEELFQQFFVLKSIVLNEPQNGKFFRTAIIHFNSQRDYYKFYDYFNECLFFDRLMDVKPLREQQKQQMVTAKQYTEFKWFVWKSHLKALVKFSTAQAAGKAMQAFKQYPKLDEADVSVSAEGCQLIIQNLRAQTDEICVEEAMKGFGDIREVEILKTPLKQVGGDDIYLEGLIKAAAPENQKNFRMEPIQKGKNGLRVCRVHFQDLNIMKKISNDLNKTTGKLGEGRLYAQTWFEKPVLVPHGAMRLYQEILAEVFKDAQNPNIHSFIMEDNHKSYIVLRSTIKQVLDAFHQKLIGSFNGYTIDLSDYQKSIILSEIGLANLMDLQEKYHCKLVVSEATKSLNVIVTYDKIKNIKSEIQARISEHFFYRLSLNSKTFKFLKDTPDKIKQIKTNYVLQLAQLQIDSKALLLQGSAVNVQKAFNYLMHLIQSLTVPQQELINADVCGICCSEPHRPYRLQKCSHKFCRACLLEYINSTLGDNSLFPMKCPHCCTEIVIDDLQCLLQAGQWGKVQIMATNQYVAKRAEVMTFCFTVGCRQINMIKSNHIECDVCLATFCIECKMKFHPGLTCEQAKHGGDELFKKYMQQNKIRQCPNAACKIPVDRVDGCYRVTCSRCNKSMCFKCDPDKMIAYDDYNACYKHLTDVHGGYW